MKASGESEKKIVNGAFCDHLEIIWVCLLTSCEVGLIVSMESQTDLIVLSCMETCNSRSLIPTDKIGSSGLNKQAS